MTHITHTRLLRQIRQISVGDAVPQDNTDISFGIFGGEDFQRTQVGLHEIARCIGKKGVVLIHNDPNIEYSLSRIYSISAQRNNYVMYLANSNGSLNSSYDPLYGLRMADVVDVIAPLSPDTRIMTDVQSLRSTITDYLSIMQWQFSQNSSAFGDYPFNLNLLIELTAMPYTKLEQNVLAYLPSDLAGSISTRLSSPEAQQRAYNAVLSFAQILSKSLWTRSSAAAHTRLSIIRAVRERNLISIYVPGSSPGILDYLSAELKALNDMSIPYLLVSCGISIQNSTSFSRLFLDNHTQLNYTTGILAEDLTGVIGNDPSGSNLTDVFAQTQEMFIFECASVHSATPFSNGIGQYYRRVIETHSESSRAPFQIFSGRGYGHTEHETQQAVINPEELIRLGAGCLVYGKNYTIPVLVDFLTL